MTGPDPKRGNLDDAMLPDYDDDTDYEDDDGLGVDCMLMEDGQCMKAGSEECDFECPLRGSEFFAGSKAWMREHGSACHKCGIDLDDGEPGHVRWCSKCGVKP